jgi:SAM-dependent methyltransferase
MPREQDRTTNLDPAAGATKTHPALPLAKPLIVALQFVNRLLRRLTTTTHRLQGALEGRFDRRRMWFDHYVDLHGEWPRDGDTMFLERGIFNRMLICPGTDVLEIACGDGFNARHFYGPVARSVLAIDIDPDALAFARRANAATNVRYEQHDIRRGLPEGSFTHVIWDAAMMFLTEEQLDRIVAEIHARVGKEGKFTGYTYIEPLEQAFVRHRFLDSEAVAAFLKRHFEHVLVLRKDHSERIQYYFLASDSPPAVAAPLLANATFA